MKLTKDQETKLTELAFAEKSNKEIADELKVELKDVHAARSRLGITIPKVKAKMTKASTRTAEEITAEISKVENAKNAAEKKIDRCIARLEELYEELVDAHDTDK